MVFSSNSHSVRVENSTTTLLWTIPKSRIELNPNAATVHANATKTLNRLRY